MLKRLAFFFALFLPAGAFAQVQYEIVSVPVCWNDSSLVKYTYVTTSGAYLDLGYFSPSGTPVTVSGGTLKTGFCFDQTFSIDSTANRTFTITLGDQTVSWTDSVGSGSGGGGITSLRLGELTDVDTTGETAGSIILYDPTSGNWEAQANSIDNLTDGYKGDNSIVIGRSFVKKPTSFDYGTIYIGQNAGPDSTLGLGNIAIGEAVFRSFIGDPVTTGNNNIAIGIEAMSKTLTGFQNVALGRHALKGNLTGSDNLALGRGAGYNNFGEPDNILTNYNQGVYIGTHATPRDTFSTNELVFGYNAVGNGSNTATFGNNNITATYLKGTTNLRGYGAGNKEATDLTKTRSAYIAAFATDGTLLELDTTGLYASGATTLNDLTDVVLTNPQINDVLKYDGTNWVNDTLTVSGGGGVLSVTANNGLNNTGTASQPVIELGGTLTRATTTINANFKSLDINRPFRFMVDSVYLAKIQTQDGLSTSSYFSLGAASNTWRSVNNDDNLTNQVRLYSSSPTQGAEISSYQNANNGVFTLIELLPQEMKIVTPNVNNTTATAGQVLKLVNASTGEAEFASDLTGATTLNDLTDVSIGTPAAGEVLKYDGINWVNDTVVNTLTATNGVRNAGSSANPEVRLGGTLLENTVIKGDLKQYDLLVDSIDNFIVDHSNLIQLKSDGLFQEGVIQVAHNSPLYLAIYEKGTQVNSVISLTTTGGIRLSSRKNQNVFNKIDIDSSAISLYTDKIRTNTASNGMFLKLIDQYTGEIEWDTIPTTGGATAFTLPTDSITFNDNNADAVEGKLQYDTDYGTLVFGAQNNTPIHIGSDMGWYVKNQTGSPIAKGIPVYVSGTDGASGRITIAPMIANNTIPAKFFLGVTAEAIANGADGFVWAHGKIRPLSLTGFSTGDVLYVSPTSAGTFTATEPTAPNLKLPVGFVVNNASNGTLAVRATIGNYLADAHDVQLTSPSNGQALKYDGTKWVNGSDLVNDADADPTNELQDLLLTGNTLSLSGDASTVDLSPYVNNITSVGSGLTLSSGALRFGGSVTTDPNLQAITTTLTMGSQVGTQITGPQSFLDLGRTTNGETTLGGVFDVNIAGLDVNIGNGAPDFEGDFAYKMNFRGNTGVLTLTEYGEGNKEAGDFSPVKTASAYLAGFATDGTLIDFPTSTFVTGATNGLTKQGNNLILGGTLTSPTTITLGSGNAFTISGTNTGLVVNQTTGIVGLGGTVTTTNYGLNNMEASDLGKTFSGNYAGFADDGTVIEVNALPISTGTSGAISWANLPQRIHVLDFGANTSITLSFTNVRVGGIYTLRVTGNSGTDTLVWPGAAKFEDGTSAGTVTLQDGGQMFTFYWDGTNYWVK